MKGLKVSFDRKNFEVIEEEAVEVDGRPDYTLDNMIVEKAIQQFKDIDKEQLEELKLNK